MRERERASEREWEREREREGDRERGREGGRKRGRERGRERGINPTPTSPPDGDENEIRMSGVASAPADGSSVHAL